MLKENLERLREYTLSVNVSEKVVEVELKEGLPGYQEWFEEIKEEVKGVREVKEEGTVPVVGNEDEKERILKDIRDFPILQKTPLDVQMFFIELQNRVVKLDK